MTSHSFKLGKNYGAILMALISLDIKFVVIQPRVWQKEFGIKRDKGESDSKWKNRLRAKARQLFPKVKNITLNTADALLILEYCRRKHKKGML